MSIIVEALKKTQNSLDKKRADRTENPATAIPSDRTSPSHKPVGTFISAMLLIFILSIAALSSVLFSLFKQSRESKLNDTIALSTPEKGPLPSNRNTPPKTKAATVNKEMTLTLQGTMRSSDGYVALIDQNIYKVGEKVDGLTIVNISDEEVILVRNGETVFLNVRNSPNL